MKKARVIIIFALLPLIAGYFVASTHAHKTTSSTNINFSLKNVLLTDKITLTEKGNIISLTQKNEITVPTKHAQLIEVNPLGNNFIGVDKQTNYASLEEFSTDGSLTNTLENGNTGNIDTMDWFTDPAVNPDGTQIAFVSDKDKDQTNVLDNALFVENLSSSTIKKIASPDPHSGGIAHPTWNPANPNILTYDYYQYDDNYNPYSIINEYDLQSQTVTPLTTQKQNAYQGSFSSDGKQFIFLERNNNITTVMYVANVTADGLSNIHSVASGDFAYPEFSLTPNHIYYLQATGNSGYDLYTATLQNGTLSGATAISTDGQLLGNSGFVVSKAQ